MGVIKQENFDSKKLKIHEAIGRISYKKDPFVYEGAPPVIELSRQIKLYTNWFSDRKSYSIGIEIEGFEFDFEGLKAKMKELVTTKFPEESFDLIKKNSRGEKMVYCKVSTDKYGKPQDTDCKLPYKKTSKAKLEDMYQVGELDANFQTCLSYTFNVNTRIHVRSKKNSLSNR